MIPVIEMGEKIKALRKKRGITQEQFAGYLNVSFQAVSKWERNESYPDITMLPRIAAFFDTSTDELLCTGKFKIEAEIEDYFARKSEFDRLGETEKSLEIMREANEKYPGNYSIMKGLMHAISANSNKRNEEERRIDNIEIIEIAEKIRSECTDDKIRESVLQILCYAYRGIGEREKAIELVETNMSMVYTCQEVMLAGIYEGDRLKDHLQYNISTFIQQIEFFVWRLAKELEPLDKIKAYETIIKMYELIYIDGDYGDDWRNLGDNYSLISLAYIKIPDYENALLNLKKAAECRIQADLVTKEYVHTSLLRNRIGYKNIITSKNTKGNNTQWMLNELSGKRYNSVRDTEEFKEIEKNLKKYARNDV